MCGTSARLDELFAEHYEDLLAWCRRRFRRELGEPADLVHAAYLRCRRSWCDARRSKEHEAAYLYQALRWVVIDALRRRQTRKLLESLLLAPSLTASDDPLRALVAREAVDRLSGRLRQVCLAVLAGKSTDQIAQELGISSGALAVCLTRLRDRLEELLGESGD